MLAHMQKLMVNMEGSGPGKTFRIMSPACRM